MISIEQAKAKLSQYNQEHLLLFFYELNHNQQKSLLKQIEETDFKYINNLYNKSLIDYDIDLENISPINCIDKADLNLEELNLYINTGNKVLSQNQYAVVTLAGGSGSRLGHNGPKGTFEVKLFEKNISIFEVLCNQLKFANQKYNIQIPWYIMTSKTNHSDTIKFFIDNNYFNYPKDKIKFFMQSELPILDITGNCVLKDKDTILTGSNGNGDVFKCLQAVGI